MIFMTYQWQKAWWQVFGRGKLLIVVAKRDENILAIAPLFEDQSMIFFVGSGGSDYLDFIGNITDKEVLENMLVLASKEVSDFLGFRFYHIPGSSQTPRILSDVATHQGWYSCEEGDLPSPVLELEKFPEQAHQATRKKSLVRHEAWFTRNGGFETHHYVNGHDVFPLLDEFFDQHIKKWDQTLFPSLFYDEKQRLFFRKLSEELSEAGWLRFTRLFWEGRSIAFHFGFNYKGSFLWYKPSYNIDMASHSPGEVLLRQLILQAQKEEAHQFDFGLGDEAFKKRFATNVPVVHTWGLYPLSSVTKDPS